MTVFTSPLAATQGTGNTNVPDHGLSSNLKLYQTVVALPATLALNDTINIGFVPRGATIRGIKVTSAGIDTANAVVFQIGDAAVPARLATVSGAVLGTGGDYSLMAQTGWGYQYTTPTMLIATVSTQGTTRVAANVRFQIDYTIDQLAS